LIRILFVLLAAPSICFSLEITNREGRIFSNATVIRTEPDGISIRHSGGITKLFWSELPAAVVQQYDPDPDAAIAYQEQKRIANLNYTREVHDAEQLRRSGLPAQTAPKKQLGTPLRVQGSVLLVRPDGLVLSDVAFPVKSMPNSTILGVAGADEYFYESGGTSWRKAGEMIFIKRSSVGYYTRAKYSGKIIRSGTHTIGSSTYPAYVPAD